MLTSALTHLNAALQPRQIFSLADRVTLTLGTFRASPPPRLGAEIRPLDDVLSFPTRNGNEVIADHY